MGKIDVLDKRFFEDRTRFAELINTEIYHGERILVPEELEPLKRSYPSLGAASEELSDGFERVLSGDAVPW